MDLREVETKLDEAWQTRTPVELVLEPGNGTRYVLVFAPLDDEWVIADMNGGRAMRWTGRSGAPHWSYVADKLEVSMADAEFVASVIGVAA